ncbi:GYF domain-containing protein [Kamptonema cortianum]|nr:GYF domain-containing protein [Geitlerinema splendidum]MDK3160971.1 GYF domain-containing protein [Kamptonema cortianum]
MRYLVKAVDGNTYGPVDLAGLKAWAAEGRIEASTEIVEDGTGLSLRASQVPGLLSEETPPVAVTQKVTVSPQVSDDKSPLWWAIASLVLTIVLTFYFSGGGIFISAYSVYASIRAMVAKNKVGTIALVISLVSLGVAIFGMMANRS